LMYECASFGTCYPQKPFGGSMEEQEYYPIPHQNIRYLRLKRTLDLLFSFLLLIFLLLPMGVIALSVALTSRGGVLFRQTRIGRDGAPFTCLKFRTMVKSAPPNRPSAGFDDVGQYLTPVGRFLRKTSLDELPQLWNVLRGDMSLVGPRPLIGEEEDVHRVRRENGVYRVRPGMTGLAQIHGRDRLANDEKAAYDIRYVSTISLREDLRIIAKSLGCVLSGENAK